MLSRTADHLFWMARYTERAENTARMLDVQHQAALLPQPDAGSAAAARSAEHLAWQGLLGISELTEAYTARHGDIEAEKVLNFMVSDMSNLSSIQSCLRAARENARAVRGAITTEVWETINQTWLESWRLLADGGFERDPAEYFEWVKNRSHLSRGVTSGTMLQDEAFHFLRIGTFLERADNTARLLDVKFHALQAEFHGSANGRLQEYDFYYWSSVLRSVSGFEVYRKVYRDVITPERVAELLILRPDMPRSLAACMLEGTLHLRAVANRRSHETLRRAGRLNAELQYGQVAEIMDTGLHAWLTGFLERINALGDGISQDFLVVS